MQPQDRRRSSVAPQGRRRSSVAPATRRRSSRWATESSFLDAAGDAGLLGLFDSRVDQDETEPATFSKALADLVARLVHLSARTPDAVRAELRSWRRAHLDALTHEDVVGLVFEELLPSVLSQLVVLKERSKVLSALGVCASVFFMCGDLFSSIGVALKLVFARSIFGYVMFGVLSMAKCEAFPAMMTKDVSETVVCEAHPVYYVTLSALQFGKDTGNSASTYHEVRTWREVYLSLIHISEPTRPY